MTVQAALTQSGLPLDGTATVWAELTRPDSTTSNLNFHTVESGRYATDFVADSAGTYRLRVRARGQTRKGLPFTRERSLTAAVWRGGDRDAETGGGGGDRLIDGLNERDERLCELFKCLLHRDGAIDPELEKRLRAAGLDLDNIRKCLEGHCAHGDKRRTQREG